MTLTAVAADAPRPSDEELLRAIEEMTLLELIAFAKALMALMEGKASTP